MKKNITIDTAISMAMSAYNEAVYAVHVAREAGDKSTEHIVRGYAKELYQVINKYADRMGYDYDLEKDSIAIMSKIVNKEDN